MTTGRRWRWSLLPHSTPGPSPGYLLWRTTLRWQRSITTALWRLDLTHVQFVLLATVWWLSDRADTPSGLPNQCQVATHAGPDVMMTSQVVRAPEKRALLARATDHADARFFTRVRNPAQLLDVLHQLADEPDTAADPRR